MFYAPDLRDLGPMEGLELEGHPQGVLPTHDYLDVAGVKETVPVLHDVARQEVRQLEVGTKKLNNYP